jgi:hypothetical protein
MPVCSYRSDGSMFHIVNLLVLAVLAVVPKQKL